MRLLESLGLPDARCVPIAGGDINDAYCVEHGGGRFFAKTHASPPPGMFAAEARALGELADAAESVCVPKVISVSDGHLALEWIGDRPGRGGGDPGESLGHGLAALHRRTASHWGWAEDNWIGTLKQPNPRLPAEAGAAAWFATRLQAQLALCPAVRHSRLERLCDRLDRLLPPERPALLHGDLWSGNWTVDPAGRSWIYDPASAYGCREADLAMTRLFGGFPSTFYAAYSEAFPQEPGAADRVDLWNLYPLLVHANLFGGGYGRQVDAIAQRYL